MPRVKGPKVYPGKTPNGECIWERPEEEDLREMRIGVGKRRTLRSKKGVERGCPVHERSGSRRPGERKRTAMEGLKRRSVHMWKIIDGNPRQNRCGWRSLSAATLEGISEILGTETKSPRWETLSVATDI
ncbi:hypothetical protein CK203_063694 [Vitis vinifera]|uniref:Uncharacterized protein n=1 Tax=Vitis vinifera TaxID=29760 RepID=A0A438G8L4_VITVI|nr:hypothetical protein CK203_063694 [Vitis vinifera]